MAELTTLEEKLAEVLGLAHEVGHWAVLGKLNESAGEKDPYEGS